VLAAGIHRTCPPARALAGCGAARPSGPFPRLISRSPVRCSSCSHASVLASVQTASTTVEPPNPRHRPQPSLCTSVGLRLSSLVGGGRAANRRQVARNVSGWESLAASVLLTPFSPDPAVSIDALAPVDAAAASWKGSSRLRFGCETLIFAVRLRGESGSGQQRIEVGARPPRAMNRGHQFAGPRGHFLRRGPAMGGEPEFTARTCQYSAPIMDGEDLR
jgi:hypothetical protein